MIAEHEIAADGVQRPAADDPVRHDAAGGNRHRLAWPERPRARLGSEPAPLSAPFCVVP